MSDGLPPSDEELARVADELRETLAAPAAVLASVTPVWEYLSEIDSVLGLGETRWDYYDGGIPWRAFTESTRVEFVFLGLMFKRPVRVQPPSAQGEPVVGSLVKATGALRSWFGARLPMTAAWVRAEVIPGSILRFWADLHDLGYLQFDPEQRTYYTPVEDA